MSFKLLKLHFDYIGGGKALSRKQHTSSRVEDFKAEKIFLQTNL